MMMMTMYDAGDDDDRFPNVIVPFRKAAKNLTFPTQHAYPMEFIEEPTWLQPDSMDCFHWKSKLLSKKRLS